MGRWGMRELPPPPPEVVGVMTHFATADTRRGVRARAARALPARDRGLPAAHAARGELARRRFASRRRGFDAGRCGVALYGLSPFQTDPAEDGLEPALLWRSELALVKQLRPGESTGYGRTFVASATRGSGSSRSATRTASGAS